MRTFPGLVIAKQLTKTEPFVQAVKVSLKFRCHRGAEPARLSIAGGGAIVPPVDHTVIGGSLGIRL